MVIQGEQTAAPVATESDERERLFKTPASGWLQRQCSIQTISPTSARRFIAQWVARCSAVFVTLVPSLFYFGVAMMTGGRPTLIDANPAQRLAASRMLCSDGWCR